ncbi:MAG: NAD(P)H-hydrate dehydratase [Brotaphodocola sp.]
MKQIDQDTITRIGIPSLVLMERAALSVADAVAEWSDVSSVLIVCGTGNNGADGIAVGRILKNRGYDVTVVLAGNPERATEEQKLQQQIAGHLDVVMIGAENFVHMHQGHYDVIVDALFGIGLGRPIEGAYRELIEVLAAEKDTRVVAVDIPSGIHADTGEVMGIALKADVTVTFGYLKSGLMLYPGKYYAGRVMTADIGFSDISLKKVGYDARVLGQSDLSQIPKRQADGNKGTFGKILIIAGSKGMCGASFLSALASYRTGAGLVKIFTVSENREILQTQIPEVIVDTYKPEHVLPGGVFQKYLEQECDWADIIVIGPGLGKDSYVESLVEMVMAYAYVPVVLDADGLNAIADHPHLARYFTENIIITPHMGEMSRLTGMAISELKADPLRAARDYSSRTGVVCVLKDAATVITDKDGNACINASGCSALAKAGSGDVLTGVIAGLLARGMECIDAAAFGVYLHGTAGEKAAKELGENSLLARDIADHLWC